MDQKSITKRDNDYIFDAGIRLYHELAETIPKEKLKKINANKFITVTRNPPDLPIVEINRDFYRTVLKVVREETVTESDNFESLVNKLDDEAKERLVTLQERYKKFRLGKKV